MFDRLQKHRLVSVSIASAFLLSIPSSALSRSVPEGFWTTADNSIVIAIGPWSGNSMKLAEKGSPALKFEHSMFNTFSGHLEIRQ